MATRKKTAVPKSPAKVGIPGEAKQAFEVVEEELRRLAPEEVLTVNVDVPRAVSIALGAEPHIQAFEAQVKEALPRHPLAATRRLRTYALAALYAHLEAQPAPKRGALTDLLSEGTALKQGLLVAADALAHAELVDGERLAEIRAGSGHLDLASDLVSLGALFDVSWAEIAEKTAIGREQVERASMLGTELLVALGARDHAANRATPEAIDAKHRAFTLLVRAYDGARRALTYLRWQEDDADLIAPSLYKKKARRTGTPEPAEDEAEVPSPPVLAPEGEPASPD